MLDEDEDIECIGDCNLVIQRETRRTKDGKPMVEDVERCIRCGRVFSRDLVANASPPQAPL
ncbi:MAG: hypothetical protein F8N37_05665 [Telmatospirillum sp.]|nr:hypothetical protein [Telmatospirillum sp.]